MGFCRDRGKPSTARASGSALHDTKQGRCLFSLLAKRSVEGETCSRTSAASNTAVFNFHSVSKFTFLDSSSAAVFFPGNKRLTQLDIPSLTPLPNAERDIIARIRMTSSHDIDTRYSGCIIKQQTDMPVSIFVSRRIKAKEPALSSR